MYVMGAESKKINWLILILPLPLMFALNDIQCLVAGYIITPSSGTTNHNQASLVFGTNEPSPIFLFLIACALLFDQIDNEILNGSKHKYQLLLQNSIIQGMFLTTLPKRMMIAVA